MLLLGQLSGDVGGELVATNADGSMNAHKGGQSGVWAKARCQAGAWW